MKQKKTTLVCRLMSREVSRREYHNMEMAGEAAYSLRIDNARLLGENMKLTAKNAELMSEIAKLKQILQSSESGSLQQTGNITAE